MPWSTSTRRQQLPPDWDTTRARILERDHHQCKHPGCTARATDVDHKQRGDDHRDANLQALCHDHHRDKTVHEAHNAMAAIRAKAKHRPERHPGLA